MRLVPHLPRALRASLALTAGLILAAPAHAADLTIEIVGARSSTGVVAVGLFAPGPGWLAERSAVKYERQPAGARTVFVMTDVPPGRYAIAATHDENGNGKLDTNLVGLPTEPYGFSRDARGVLSQPAFDDAAIDVRADATLTIRVR